MGGYPPNPLCTIHTMYMTTVRFIIKYNTKRFFKLNMACNLSKWFYWLSLQPSSSQFVMSLELVMFECTTEVEWNLGGRGKTISLKIWGAMAPWPPPPPMCPKIFVRCRRLLPTGDWRLEQVHKCYVTVYFCTCTIMVIALYSLCTCMISTLLLTW